MKLVRIINNTHFPYEFENQQLILCFEHPESGRLIIPTGERHGGTNYLWPETVNDLLVRGHIKIEEIE